MSGHTPGPWMAEEADMFGDHNIILQNHEALEDERAIAAVVSNLRPTEEVEANARLIAAAPELLEALEDSLPELVALLTHLEDAPELEGKIAKARAVIAKAYGHGSSSIRSESPETNCPESERTSAGQSENALREAMALITELTMDLENMLDATKAPNSHYEPCHRARAFLAKPNSSEARATGPDYPTHEWIDGLDGVDVTDVVEQLVNALEPFVEGAAHTQVFLRSREKMHPAGQALYQEDVDRARAAIAKARGDQP